MSAFDLRDKARKLIDKKWFERSSLWLVVFSLATFVVETIPSLEARYASILDAIETLIILLFSAEYLIRLAAKHTNEKDDNNPGGKAYAFGFWGIIDLATVLPFWLAITGLDGRPIRAFRLVRVLRLVKLLGRQREAVERIRIGWSLAKEELGFALAGSLFMIFMAAVFIHFFERHAQPEAFGSVPDAIWWAVVTFTTIGYGDVTPITEGGKIFSFALNLLALVMVGVPAGIVASALSMARESVEAQKWEKDEKEHIDNVREDLTEIEREIKSLILDNNLEDAETELARLKWPRKLINPFHDATVTREARHPREHEWDQRRDDLENTLRDLMKKQKQGI